MARNKQIVLRNGEKIILTEKQLLFANYYLSDAKRNATQAAIMAGYSKRTAHSIGQENLHKPEIQRYIDDQTLPVLDALGASKDAILAEWAYLALSRPGQQITKDGDIPLGYQETYNFKTLSIEGTQVDSVDKSVSFNYGPKIKALERISEHHGIGPKNNPEDPVQGQGGTTNIFQQINQFIINQ